MLWLLFQTAVSTVNAKLALFFDWLFYQPDKDNIMNIGNATVLLYTVMLYLKKIRGERAIDQEAGFLRRWHRKLERRTFSFI